MEEVLPMLTENPARLVRIFDRKGSIHEGKDADLLLLDAKGNVLTTFVGGKAVYRTKEKQA